MAKRISQLPAETVAATGDQIPFYDLSTGTTKRVTVQNLFNSIPQLIGPTVIDFSVADATARGALTPFKGMIIYQDDINELLMYTGTRWRYVNAPHRLGSNVGADVGTITTSYVTHATVTATTLGGSVDIDIAELLSNAGSGSAKTADIKVQCDGVDVGTPFTGMLIMASASNNPYQAVRLLFSHTPTAGSHTWTLQSKASANTAVSLYRPTIIVNETS